ncbi:THAP domain-containing protein 11 [Arapaima gigas]
MPGFTCCVPGCYNNSHRDRELRFYTFPKDTAQREIWLKNISRAGVSGCFSTFQPTTGHRVCSSHFPGGRKTYSIRVPTLFPLRGVNERKSRRGRNRKVSAALPLVAGLMKPEPNSVDLTLQGDGPCLSALESISPAVTELMPSRPASPRSASALDHPYSLRAGTTPAELLKKLNEQRDIIALMEVKMKEMKSTIRQLRVTEAELREEVRERDRMLGVQGVRRRGAGGGATVFALGDRHSWEDWALLRALGELWIVRVFSVVRGASRNSQRHRVDSEYRAVEPRSCSLFYDRPWVGSGALDNPVRWTGTPRSPRPLLLGPPRSLLPVARPVCVSVCGGASRWASPTTSRN